jgi:four helix bundle protein
MSGRGYQDLVAWQKAMDLVVAVYRLTADLPPEERFGLTAQLRRAAVSIPSNIAEGQVKSSPRDFSRFLEYSLGSLAESDTQLILTHRLDYLPLSRVEPIIADAAEVSRIVHGLRRSLPD